jgi:glutathione S-transferase
MKLFHNPLSPYVRKVMVLLHETGQLGTVERVEVALTPVQPDAGVNAENPAGKIPALRLDDGSVLHDSRVILDYLDSLHDGAPLIPREGPLRWQRLTLASLADALSDAALLLRYENTLRPEEKRWDAWQDGQTQKIERSLAHFETQVAALSSAFDVAAVSVACALGYLDLRHPQLAWRERYPQLAAWFAEVGQRPSMQATQAQR